MRAKAMYYHQIGYYAMRIEGALDERLLLVPHYAKMFTGDDWLIDCQTADQVRERLIGYKRRKSMSRSLYQICIGALLNYI